MLLADVLRLRGDMRARERWTRAELERHQEARLHELLAFARARSPFYRELHAGLEKAPLDALPVVSKATLMDQFDRVVTDPRVRRADVDADMAASSSTPPPRERGSPPSASSTVACTSLSTSVSSR